MPQKRKAETYDKSDHFIVDDDDEQPTSSKRSKATTTSKTSTSSTAFSTATSILTPEMKRDDEGNEFWEISKARRVGISDFKGKKMVSIREYYEKDGKMLPGKKGITMTVEQYSAFIMVLPQIEVLLKEKGETVPRPGYDGGGPVREVQKDEQDNEDEEEEEEDKGNGKRSNIDVTSDEDED